MLFAQLTSPRADSNSAQPKAEQPKAEQPKAEQPKAEQPKPEPPKPEPPKPEPAAVTNIDAAAVVNVLGTLGEPVETATRWLGKQLDKIKHLPPWGSKGGVRGALFELGVVDVMSVADWAGLLGAVDFSRYRIFGTPPVIGPKSSSYGWRHHPVLRRRKLHKGVDFRAGTGTRVYASAPGRVIYAARMGTYGNLVKIDHGEGLETRYAHLRRIKVRKGDYIAAGTIIGLVGATGRVTGPHLHFEVRLNDEPLDPSATFIVPLFNKKPKVPDRAPRSEWTKRKRRKRKKRRKRRTKKRGKR